MKKNKAPLQKAKDALLFIERRKRDGSVRGDEGGQGRDGLPPKIRLVRVQAGQEALRESPPEIRGGEKDGVIGMEEMKIVWTVAAVALAIVVAAASYWTFKH